MKKILSLVLALAMVLLCATAFAAVIQVKDVIDGEQYTAYKILNYTQNGEAVSYYLSDTEYASIGSVLEAAGFAFTASSDGTQYFLNNGDTVDVGAAAEYLGTANLGNALGKYGPVTGANGEAAFTDLPVGYYFVTSSAGSLCALHDEDGIATVVEKNTIPGEDKKQSKDGTTYTDDQLDLNIGDKVYYEVEITDGKGTDADIVLTDTLTAGLTFDGADSITVTKGGAAVDPQNYRIENVTASGYKLTFLAAYIATVNESEKLLVKYTATINENAVIDGDNVNTVKLEYSHQSFTDSTVVKTYDFIVYKTDGTKFLDGAEFKLYDAETGGNQILVTKEAEGKYVKDAGGDPDTNIDINSATGCNVRGLEPGTYWLEEVVVPEGYNKLAARQSVTVVKNQTAAAEITVVNNSGTELPSTGGIGTTIFYILGGLLVVGAAVVLVARRKAHD